jgi:uncharacterized DUF497 family protein
LPSFPFEYTILNTWKRDSRGNPAKPRANERNHGISFEAVREVFGDPNQVVAENYYFADEGEQRHLVIGMMLDLTLVVVVFVRSKRPACGSHSHHFSEESCGL